MKSFIDHIKNYVDPSHASREAKPVSHAQQSMPQPHQASETDAQHIARFHELHRQLEEAGHHLHKRGYHIDIDYKSHMAARHGRDGMGSSLSFNQALLCKKEVKIKKGINVQIGNHSR